MQHIRTSPAPPTPLEADAAASGVPWHEREPVTFFLHFRERQAIDRMAAACGVTRREYLRGIVRRHLEREGMAQ